MKGDTIYCLSCKKFSKDVHSMPDSRNEKVKRLCPHCTGTNTVNANYVLSIKKMRYRLLAKRPKEEKRYLKMIGIQMKELGIITSYQISTKKDTAYLYDCSSLRKEIKAAMEKENIYIPPITK